MNTHTTGSCRRFCRLPALAGLAASVLVLAGCQAESASAQGSANQSSANQSSANQASTAPGSGTQGSGTAYASGGAANGALSAFTPTTPEQQVLYDWYAAYESGDLDSTRELFTEDLVWELSPGSPFSRPGGVQGRGEIFDNYFAEQVDFTDQRLAQGWRMELEDVRQSGDKIFAQGFYSLTPAGSDVACEAPFVHVWEYDGDRIAHMTQYTDTVLTDAALENNMQECGYRPQGL